MAEQNSDKKHLDTIFALYNDSINEAFKSTTLPRGLMPPRYTSVKPNLDDVIAFVDKKLKLICPIAHEVFMRKARNGQVKWGNQPRYVMSMDDNAKQHGANVGDILLSTNIFADQSLDDHITIAEMFPSIAHESGHAAVEEAGVSANHDDTNAAYFLHEVVPGALGMAARNLMKDEGIDMNIVDVHTYINLTGHLKQGGHTGLRRAMEVVSAPAITASIKRGNSKMADWYKMTDRNAGEVFANGNVNSNTILSEFQKYLTELHRGSQKEGGSEQPK